MLKQYFVSRQCWRRTGGGSRTVVDLSAAGAGGAWLAFVRVFFRGMRSTTANPGGGNGSGRGGGGWNTTVIVRVRLLVSSFRVYVAVVAFVCFSGPGRGAAHASGWNGAFGLSGVCCLFGREGSSSWRCLTVCSCQRRNTSPSSPSVPKSGVQDAAEGVGAVCLHCSKECVSPW